MTPTGPGPTNAGSVAAPGIAGVAHAGAGAQEAEVLAALSTQDGVVKLVEELSRRFSLEDVVIADGAAQSGWATLGCALLQNGRPYEALDVFWKLYTLMLDAQKGRGWIHKSLPLVWMSECFNALGYPAHAKRYLMLTLCEDAIRDKGTIDANAGGIYFRLVWRGLSHAAFNRYATEFWSLYGTVETRCFPEALLQRVDNDWMTEIPSAAEALVYRCNTAYVEQLIARLGDGTGQVLEVLAEYIVSCMPGCRTHRRKRSESTDYDIVCSVDGPELDFRSELGRYFVCECKDWATPADFTSMAKFCRILDSTKTRFGILFSREGVSGAERTKFAAREQLKVFQDRGIVIVVVDRHDLGELASGASLITMLRRRYEEVRLDLAVT